MKISFCLSYSSIMFPHNILLLFAMQLLIFVLLVDRQVFAIQTVLSHSDSLNIIPLTKKNVKHFLKIFEIFVNFFEIFYFCGIFLSFRARITLYIIYKERRENERDATNTKTFIQIYCLLFLFISQPTTKLITAGKTKYNAFRRIYT